MDSSQKPTTINHFYEKLLKLQVPCAGSLTNLRQASIFQQDVHESVCQTLNTMLMAPYELLVNWCSRHDLPHITSLLWLSGYDENRCRQEASQKQACFHGNIFETVHARMGGSGVMV